MCDLQLGILPNHATGCGKTFRTAPTYNPFVPVNGIREASVPDRQPFARGCFAVLISENLFSRTPPAV